MEARRLMVYDRTDLGPWWRPGLSHSWWLGGHLYRGRGHLDAWQGFSRWEALLDWLLAQSEISPLVEVQFWGHGKWGAIMLDGARLDAKALRTGHPLYPRLRTLAERMEGPHALWWFRTCETFGGEAGHEFARAWVTHFGCRAAGHTYIIGPWQSGLHSLCPGAIPSWPIDEAIAEGTPQRPRRARWSTRREPHTITFLHPRVPSGW